MFGTGVALLPGLSSVMADNQVCLKTRNVINIGSKVLIRLYLTAANDMGKLQGECPAKRVRIVWTAGWVEPGDKWMMMPILG